MPLTIHQKIVYYLQVTDFQYHQNKFMFVGPVTAINIILSAS
jgi:hypothetical protein